MSRQIEFTNNFRTQQRDDVRTNGKLEAGKDFFSDSRAAEHVTPLEHQHTLAGARKICGINQTIVSAADDDDVVFLHAYYGIAFLLKWMGIITYARDISASG